MTPDQIKVAATTVVITLTLTGALKWLFSLLDAVVPFSKAPEKLRTALQVKTLRALLLYVLWIALILVQVIVFVLGNRPMTRVDVLYGASIIGCLFLSVLTAASGFALHRMEKRRTTPPRTKDEA